jgi:hypothetical protein
MTDRQLAAMKTRLDAEWTRLCRSHTTRTENERDIQAAIESALSALDREKMIRDGVEFWTGNLWTEGS